MWSEPVPGHRRVWLAVGGENLVAVGFALHGHRRSTAILVESDGEVIRCGQSAESVDAAREQLSIEAHPRRRKENKNGGDRQLGERWRSRRRASRQRDVQENQSDCDVQRGAGDEKELEAEDGEKEQASQLHPDDGAGGIRSVDLTNCGFLTVAVKNARDQRQRRARAKRGGQHYGEANHITRDGESNVAPGCLREDADEIRDPVERRHVERKCRDGERSHRTLDESQDAQRIAPAVRALADGHRAKREAEYERRQHELERVRRAAEYERQHSDPGDLVGEGCYRGAERSAKKQKPRTIDIRDSWRRGGRAAVRSRRLPSCERSCPSADERERDDCYREVQRCGESKRAGK